MIEQLLPELGEGFTPRVLGVLTAGRVTRDGRNTPVYRVPPRRLNAAQARRALRTQAGVFLAGADRDQARGWLLSLLPAAHRDLVHEVHGDGRPHWHVDFGDDRTGHVFYGARRPRGSFFATP